MSGNPNPTFNAATIRSNPYGLNAAVSQSPDFPSDTSSRMRASSQIGLIANHHARMQQLAQMQAQSGRFGNLDPSFQYGIPDYSNPFSTYLPLPPEQMSKGLSFKAPKATTPEQNAQNVMASFFAGKGG